MKILGIPDFGRIAEESSVNAPWFTQLTRFAKGRIKIEPRIANLASRRISIKGFKTEKSIRK